MAEKLKEITSATRSEFRISIVSALIKLGARESELRTIYANGDDRQWIVWPRGNVGYEIKKDINHDAWSYVGIPVALKDGQVCLDSLSAETDPKISKISPA